MPDLWDDLIAIARRLGLAGRVIRIPKPPPSMGRADLIRLQHRQNLRTYDMDDDESIRLLAMSHRLRKEHIRQILRND